MSNKIYSEYRGISDEEWFNILKCSVNNNEIKGVRFPQFPDSQIQISYVGSANEHALNEVWPYYQHILKICNQSGIEFNETTRLLDVGSGWGRILRCFLKDIHPDNLYGVDTMPSSVNLCRSLFDEIAHFSVIKNLPPTHFQDSWFDVVEGYSVVSHLSRHSGLMWLDEYYRILKPGGILAMTVWKTTHYNVILNWQKTMMDNTSESYQSKTARRYTKGCALEKKTLNSVGFDYKSYGSGIEGNDSTTYGEAIMSLDYIKRYWCRYFDFVAYIDTQDLAQALVVLKKPEISDNVSITEDAVRNEQYELMKQLDVVNGLNSEFATSNYFNQNQEAPNPNTLKYEPSEVGYKKLALHHSGAAINALASGLKRRFKALFTP